MPETIHCSLCGKSIKGEDFANIMAKLRRHRKRYHPIAFRKSIKKSVATRKESGRK